MAAIQGRTESDAVQSVQRFSKYSCFLTEVRVSTSATLKDTNKAVAMQSVWKQKKLGKLQRQHPYI